MYGVVFKAQTGIWMVVQHVLSFNGPWKQRRPSHQLCEPHIMKYHYRCTGLWLGHTSCTILLPSFHTKMREQLLQCKQESKCEHELWKMERQQGRQTVNCRPWMSDLHPSGDMSIWWMLGECHAWNIHEYCAGAWRIQKHKQVDSGRICKCPKKRAVLATSSTKRWQREGWLSSNLETWQQNSGTLCTRTNCYQLSVIAKRETMCEYVSKKELCGKFSNVVDTFAKTLFSIRTCTSQQTTWYEPAQLFGSAKSELLRLLFCAFFWVSNVIN